MNKKILYLHGMGGHGTDGIYTGLQEYFGKRVFGTDIKVEVHTLDYDFDPEIGHAQIVNKVNEVQPDLIVAISLGAFHSRAFAGIPHVLVCPALNAGNVIAAFGKEFEKHPFKRLLFELQLGGSSGHQKLTTSPKVLKKYAALAKTFDEVEHTEEAYAVYGSNDMYMQLNVVNPEHFKSIFKSNNIDTIQGADHNFSGYDVMGYVIPQVCKILKLND